MAPDPTDVTATLLAIRHEINNPLAALMLNVEMLQEGGHEDSSELVEEIDRAAKRIAAIVRRLESIKGPQQRPVTGESEMDGSQGGSPVKKTPEASGPAPAADQASSGKTILLVDDEESVRAIVNKILVRHGHTVLEAEHGADAVRLAADHEGKIDLLITDMYMPGLRGPEIAESLVGTRPGLKVLYMSGYADEDIARSGVDPSLSFLRKPFTVQELSEAVERALSGEGS